jgi:hypothetical protein
MMTAAVGIAKPSKTDLGQNETSDIWRWNVSFQGWLYSVFQRSFTDEAKAKTSSSSTEISGIYSIRITQTLNPLQLPETQPQQTNFEVLLREGEEKDNSVGKTRVREICKR